MKISKPLPTIDLMNKFEPEQLFPCLPDYKAVDEKGRYLHWHDFQFRNPQNSELKWLAVKLNRASLKNTIKLGDEIFSFCVPDSLQSQLHFVDKATGGNVGTTSLSGLSKAEQDRFLLKSLIMEEAITSAQLEGAVTTRKVAKEMLETERKPKTKDEIMIVNNYKLMTEAIKLKDQPLSLDLILEFHRLATNNAIENNAAPGEFRTDNEIYIADNDGNKIHQPPAYEKLSQLMEDLCQFANEEHNGEEGALFIHPVIKAIILHFLIGYIHPFGDGNGRTARALFYWFMLKSGYWLFEYISISRLLKVAPVKYAKAYIYTETDELDMTYFIYYQMDIIKRAINALETYITNKQSHFKKFMGEIAKFTAKSSVKINDRQMRILQKAVKNTGYIFTAKEICNEYGVTENTARKDLKTLHDLNLLGVFKVGKSTGYISPSDLLERLQRS